MTTRTVMHDITWRRLSSVKDYVTSCFEIIYLLTDIKRREQALQMKMWTHADMQS